MAPRLTFMRFIQNVVPNFANDAKNDVDMTPAQADNLVRYHLSHPHSHYLDANSLMIAGICDHIKVAEKTLKILQKYGYALPPPPPNSPAAPAASSSGSQNAAATVSTPAPTTTVNTYIIDKNLPSRFAIISVHAHRKLISLLFFWEEECIRWNMLDKQEAEILEIMKTPGASEIEDLKVALEQVRLKKLLLPSQRAEGTSTVFPAHTRPEEMLPVYPHAS